MQTAIFDLDGTLIDSMGVWASAPALTLERLGLEPTGEESEIFRVRGYRNTAIWMVEHYGLDMDYHLVMKMMDESVIPAYENGIALISGVREYLTKLKEKGIRTCVFTANNRNLLDLAVQNNDLENLFDGLWTATEFNMYKSDPRVFSMLCSKMGVKESSCILFEDSSYSVETAGRVGIRSVGILSNDRDSENERLRNMCMRCITSFAELMKEDVF